MPNCDEKGCEREAHPELYCAIGKHFCPQHWLELLPPARSQWDNGRQDEIARQAIEKEDIIVVGKVR